MSEQLCSIEGCDRLSKARGWCGTHWLTWRRHGTPLHDYVAARFWSKVEGDVFTECWEWVGSRGSHGYGVFSVQGRQRMAHRWAYEHLIADIPAGLQIDHLCFNRGCVNPWHLEPVTPQVNTLRNSGPSARNAAKTHCPREHPYNEQNTRIKGGRRVCRTCARDDARARRVA